MEAIDALKQKILSLAIQGKLVPQDSSDEPASELLKKIKTEKAELVKQGKIKKDKQESHIYKGDDNKYYEQIGSETKDITDEIPFDIPNNWCWVRFKDIVSYNMGKTPERGHKRYWNEATIPWVSISDMIPSQHINKTKEKITETALKEVFHERFSPKGTLIMSFKLTVGRTSIIDFDAVHNEAIISIYPYQCLSRVFQEYLLRFLPVFSSLAQSHDAIKGKTLNSKSIDNIFIPLPPLSEQNRIVSEIERIFKRIYEVKANQEELSRLKDGLKNKILDLAIQGKLVPQDPNDEPASKLLEKIKAEKTNLVKQGKIKKDKQESFIYKTPDNRHYGDDKNHYTYFEQIGSETKEITEEIPFEIPDSWEWVRFKNIFNIISSKRVLQSDWKSEGIPFYRAREIARLAEFGFVNNELYISEELFNELSKAYLMPEKNDIMLSAVGTIGKAYIVKDSDRFYYKDASVLCYKNYSQILPEYAKLFIESNCFVSQYAKDSGGTTVDTLTIIRANQYVIPLPPLSEQKRIVAKVDELLSVIKFL